MRSLYADGDPTTLKAMSLRCCYAVGISATLTLRQRSLYYDATLDHFFYHVDIVSTSSASGMGGSILGIQYPEYILILV